MKMLVLATALMAAVAVSAPAEAAPKRSSAYGIQQADHGVASDSYMVIDGDGEILGRDPDPFIRMMLRKDGSLRHQSGR